MAANAVARQTAVLGSLQSRTSEISCFCCPPLKTACEYRLTDLVISAAKVLAKKRAHNKHVLQQALSSASNEGVSVRL